MSYADEARYGRASLLLLNVCPFTLRHVINDYQSKHGYTSLQDFLNKNKHDLYHLLNRRCCCGLIQRRSTPMNRSQWDLLFIKNSSSCRSGYTGDCQCQYDAKPGITSDVMDITLCCLIIKNICIKHAGINMSHVDTLRTIRNHIIHAKSAQLDVLTYNGYWSQVKTAILDLANHVSSTVHTDTSSMIQDLETRTMNAGELGEIRKVLVDQKRMEEVEENLSDIKGDLDTTNKNVANVEENVSQLEGNVSHLERNMRNVEGNVSKLEENVKAKFTDLEGGLSQTSTQLTKLGETAESSKRKLTNLEQTVDQKIKQIRQEVVNPRADNQTDQKIKQIRQEVVHPRADNLTDGRVDVTKLKQELIRVNEEATRNISISPLQEGDDKVPIELLYASVVIREDPKYAERENSFQTRREVTNPDDIFKKDREITKTIYLLGDAAHGKTTYCLWLAKKWCNAQQRKSKEIQVLGMWEKALLEFDFVFLLKFRYVNANRASVIDMICQDTLSRVKDCHDTVRHVLSSDKYRSLIIMDGLDEWNPNEESRKQLTYQAMPNIYVSSSVSCFFTMRPWVFASISKMVKMSDKVIEIHGLSENGVEKVVDNVLLNHYRLKEDIEKFKSTKENIAKYLYMKNVKSFMKIPLLAVVCVQIWYKEKQLGDSMTSFYASMLDMLIERASEKHKHQILQNNDNTANCELSEHLSEYENIQNCIYVLLKIGKVAYEGLISNETNLVFQKRKLEKEIGVKELQFALDVGLISQKEAPSLLTKNVSLHFFHKSIQEFLAVIYIVTKKEVGESFCKHLSSVTIIMELSNVIMFICGMCPSLGSVISHHVVSITDSVTEICEYRESSTSLFYSIRAKELYKLQINWYKELQDRESDDGLTFHVSDVHLHVFHSSIETIRVSKRFLSHQRVVDIRSLYLEYVPTDGECGITNTELKNFLSNEHTTRSLVKVCIYDNGTDRSVPPLCIPSLRYLQLHNVKINDTHLDSNACHQLLTHMAALRTLWLHNVILGDRGLNLSDMTSLQTLNLAGVNLRDRGLNLSQMTSLQELVLIDVTLDDRELNLSEMTLLRELRLCHVNNGDMRLDISHMASLCQLNLSRVILEGRGLDLSCMTSLRKLTLNTVNLCDRRLDLSGMTSLLELELDNVDLSDGGLDLSDMTSLQVLKLSLVTLGVKGLQLYETTSFREFHRLSTNLDYNGPLPSANLFTNLGYNGPLPSANLFTNLGYNGPLPSANMAHIREVTLKSLNMSAVQWHQFTQSVLNIRHKFNVKLVKTNIDDESRTMIRSSPEFNVTQDGIVKDFLGSNENRFFFTRV